MATIDLHNSTEENYILSSGKWDNRYNRAMVVMVEK